MRGCGLETRKRFFVQLKDSIRLTHKVTCKVKVKLSLAGINGYHWLPGCGRRQSERKRETTLSLSLSLKCIIHTRVQIEFHTALADVGGRKK